MLVQASQEKERQKRPTFLLIIADCGSAVTRFLALPRLHARRVGACPDRCRIWALCFPSIMPSMWAIGWASPLITCKGAGQAQRETV